LLNGEASLVKNLAKRSGPNPFMIGNDDASVRLCAAQNHVTPSLTLELKPNAFECPPQFLAG